MSVSTNAAGVAICSCGHELEIRCTGGCVLPDPVFEDNYIAALPKPRGRESPQLKYPPPTSCRTCGGELPPHIPGKGRPPAFCLEHRHRQNRSRPIAAGTAKICNECDQPVAPYQGFGRPPTKCIKHFSPVSARKKAVA